MSWLFWIIHRPWCKQFHLELFAKEIVCKNLLTVRWLMHIPKHKTKTVDMFRDNLRHLMCPSGNFPQCSHYAMVHLKIMLLLMWTKCWGNALRIIEGLKKNPINHRQNVWLAAIHSGDLIFSLTESWASFIPDWPELWTETDWLTDIIT